MIVVLKWPLKKNMCLWWKTNNHRVITYQFTNSALEKLILKSKVRTKCPSNFDDYFIKVVLKSNLWQSTRGIEERLNVSQSNAFHRLKKLEKVGKFGVWVPHSLTEQNKEYGMSISASLLSLENKRRLY